MNVSLSALLPNDNPMAASAETRLRQRLQNKQYGMGRNTGISECESKAAARGHRGEGEAGGGSTTSGMAATTKTAEDGGSSPGCGGRVHEQQPQLHEQQPQQQLQRWRMCEELGRGAHGTVYRALLLDTGESIAVKQILTSGMQRSALQAAENEVGMLRRLRHPNIVPFLGVERVDEYLNIFLEYMDGGSLRRHLDRKGPMSERQTASVTRKVLSGLSYLHSNDITHRDIKSANVLLSKEGAVKLADFGTSKSMNQDSVLSGMKGTPNWMAPEVIDTALQSARGGWLQADVWSVGCTVVEMLTGKMPWPKTTNPYTVMYQVAQGGKPPMNREVSEDALSFMAVCFAKDPSQRHTVEQLMKHPFLVRRARSSSSSRARARCSPQAPLPSLPLNPNDINHHHEQLQTQQQPGDDAGGGGGIGGGGGRGAGRLYRRLYDLSRPQQEQEQEEQRKQLQPQGDILRWTSVEALDLRRNNHASNHHNHQHQHHHHHPVNNKNLASSTGYSTSVAASTHLACGNSCSCCGSGGGYRHQGHGAGGAEEGEASRPPCRSRETAAADNNSNRGRCSRNVRGERSGGGGGSGNGSGEGREGRDRRRCRQQQQLQQGGSEPWVGNNGKRSPTPTPTRAGAGRVGLSPGEGAAGAAEGSAATPRDSQVTRKSHHDRHHEAETTDAWAMMTECGCMRSGASCFGNEGPSRQGSFFVAADTGPSSGSGPPSPPHPFLHPRPSRPPSPPTPPQRSSSSSPQTHKCRNLHQHHHQQKQQPQQQRQCRRALSAKRPNNVSMVAEPRFSSSPVVDSEERRQSLTFMASWSNAGDGCGDGHMAQVGERRDQLQDQDQQQQSPHPAPEPRPSKPVAFQGHSRAGTTDRSFATSPVVALRRHYSEGDRGGGGGGAGSGSSSTGVCRPSGSRSEVTAAPSHGGSDFSGVGGIGSGDGGGGGDSTRSPLPDISKGTRRGGSSYNSPVQVVKAAREDLLEQSGGGGGGAGEAAAAGAEEAGAATAAAVAVAAASHRARPDDPITGEYLKLERQRGLKGLVDSSVPSRGSEMRRRRSNSMPMQTMRTKSAGLLGACAKLPPLERNVTGGVGEGATHGGEGGGAADRGEVGDRNMLGDLARASGWRRNITSAPTVVGSYHPAGIVPPPAAVAAAAAASSARMNPEKAGKTAAADAAAATPASGEHSFRPIDRAADRAAGLAVVARHPAERSLDWSAASVKGFPPDFCSPRDPAAERGGGGRVMTRNRCSLAPIGGEKATAPGVAAVVALAAPAEAAGGVPMISASLSSGGLGSSAASGFGAMGSSSDRSGFSPCLTPGAAYTSGGGIATAAAAAERSSFLPCSTPCGAARKSSSLGGVGGSWGSAHSCHLVRSPNEARFLASTVSDGSR